MTRDDQPKSWDFGWHPDPDDPASERYWNGSEWTDRRRPVTDSTAPEPDVDRDIRSPWLIAAGVVSVLVAVVVLVVSLRDEADSIANSDDAGAEEVTITSCEPPGLLGSQEVRGVAENGSSERSDYRIEVAVAASDGTRIGTGQTTVTDVEPGQRAVWSAETDADEGDWDDGSTCTVTSVDRTASV